MDMRRSKMENHSVERNAKGRLSGLSIGDGQRASDRSKELRRNLEVLLCGIRAQERLENEMDRAARYIEDLYEDAPVGLCTIDGQGRVLDVNRTGCLMLGAERLRIRKSRLAGFFDKESQSILKRHLDSISAGRREGRCKVRMAGRSGTWLEMHLVANSGSLDGEVLPGAFRIAMVPFRSGAGGQEPPRWFDEVPLPAVLVGEGFLALNPAAETLTGYSGDELVSPEQWFDRVLGLDGEGAQGLRQKLRDGGFCRSVGACQLRRGDGAERPVRVLGHSFDAWQIWWLEDLSGEALNRDHAGTGEGEVARASLAALCSASPSAIVITDKNEVVQQWNPAAERMFGYRAEEILGKRISVLLPSGRNHGVPEDVDSFSADDACRKVETVRLHKSGRRMDVSLVIAPIQREDGSVMGYASLYQDPRTEKWMEGQVAAAADAEKHRIGMELHDGLGSLLTVIDCRVTSLSRLLEARGCKSEAGEAAEISAEIRGAIRQLRNLASGLQPLDDEPESLVHALRNLALRVGRAKRIRCRFLAPRKPVLLRDASEANHLFAIACEAVQNAIRHSGGTSITIQLEVRRGLLCLSVVDNGKGVDDRELQSSGMGIGTMNCRARLIGARLSIVRRREGGTRVCCEAGRIGRSG
jgi:PAS domain S-box-containing protein